MGNLFQVDGMTGNVTTAGSITAAGGLISSASDITLQNQHSLIFDDTSVNSITLHAPTTITSSYSLILPLTQGGAGTFLQNDGSGNLSWMSASGAVTSVTGTAGQITASPTTGNVILSLNLPGTTGLPGSTFMLSNGSGGVVTDTSLSYSFSGENKLYLTSTSFNPTIWIEAQGASNKPLLVFASDTNSFDYNLSIDQPTGALSFATGSTAPSQVGPIAFFRDGSIGMGSGGITTVASALISMASTTRGFLPPRMTTTQRNAIASPATGLQIYNTTTSENEFYNGSVWGPFAVAAGSTGDIQFNSSGAFAGSSNLFWDNSNNRLGLGTSSPVFNIDVAISGANMRLGTSTNYARLDASGEIGVGTDVGNFPAYYVQDTTSFDRWFMGMTNYAGATTSFGIYFDNLPNTPIVFTKPPVSTQLTRTAIGSPAGLPDASAVLDVQSTAFGFLLPRMTTTQRNAISSPATGLQIYNTTTNQNEFYNGSAWGSLGAPSSGVSGAVQFSGGSGAFSSDATKFFWDDTNIRLGLGTNTPTSYLHIADNSATTAPLILLDQQGSGHSQIQFNGGGSNATIGWDGSEFSWTSGSSDVRFIGGLLRLDGSPITLSSVGSMFMLSTGAILSQAQTSFVFDTNSGGSGVCGWTGTGSATASSSGHVTAFCNSNTNTLMVSQNAKAYAPVAVTSVTSVSTTYTVLSTDYTVLSDATSAAFAVTLPSVSLNIGRIFNIKKVDSSANAITVTPASGTIDGASTQVLSSQYQSITVQSDGTNWWVI